jgi:hypothetical protein
MMPTTKNPLSYYYGSIAASIVAVIIAFIMGGLQAATGVAFAVAGIAVAIKVAFLIVLETSLSLDNAAVNARILKHWDHKWQQIFLKWGILIAVFGMRIVFPLLIVAVIAGIGPIAVVHLALDNPTEYSRILTAAHPQVAGFGGAFLMLVGLSFFFAEKNTYWVEWAEAKLAKFGGIDGVSIALTIMLLFFVRQYVEHGQGAAFFDAGLWGVVTYVITHGLGTLMGGDEDESEDTGSATGSAIENASGTIIRAGLMGFLYLEVLDSSFSFDGVIGAFAITNYLPFIALGLGAGAFFVRSFTIHMVEAGVMDEYRYLEHGAFYAIMILATIMFVSATGIEIPEWITGLVGAAVLGTALVHSIIANRRDHAAPTA